MKKEEQCSSEKLRVTQEQCSSEKLRVTQEQCSSEKIQPDVLTSSLIYPQFNDEQLSSNAQEIERIADMIYKNDIINEFAQTKECNGPVGELAFLDFEYKGTKNSPKKRNAKRFKKKRSKPTNPITRDDILMTDNFIGLCPKRKMFQLESYNISASITNTQIEELKAFGIDACQMVEGQIAQESKSGVIKQVLEKIDEHGENFYKSQFTQIDKFKQFIWKIFKKHYVKEFDVQNNVRKLINRILLYSNMIAVEGRIGPATAVIVGPKLGTAIQDSGLTFVQSNKAKSSFIYEIGKIAGIKIFINANLNWSDNSVTILRKTTNQSNGIYVPYFRFGIAITTISEGSMSPKISIRTRHAIIDTPGTKHLIKKFYVKNLNI